jgi:D-psicose/D-tagatose/L-ribulose 3-epimerase
VNLAVSNIAWTAAEDDAIAQLLAELGVKGLEIAPTRVWPAPLEATAAQIDEFRERWAAHGIGIVAMQALLFGRPDLVIFGSEDQRAATLKYLQRVMAMAARLGAKALVFGSPKNRQRGGMPIPEAEEIAAKFFAAAGAAAEAEGVTLCIEPNAEEYGCDFLVTTQEAVEFLERVPSKGIGLHLDAAMLKLNGEEPAGALRMAAPRLKYFHVSEPSLAVIGTAGVDHASTGRAVKASGYAGWKSIEMRAGEAGTNVANVRAAVEVARRHY